jgi:hypothetical protein
MVNLEELVAKTCDEYVERWKTEGKKYIHVKDFENAYLENNITPIERESTLVERLKVLNKENPSIPPEIPLFPLPILRRLAVHLTKTLEIQVNRDHYEYWAWSAEVFKEFEASSQVIKMVKEPLFLLFHICLARLEYTPLTRESQVLNKVIDEVVDEHVKHIVYNKFVIGIPVGAATLEALLKMYIKLYGPEDSRRELEELERRGKATLGRTLEVFEGKVLPHVPHDLHRDVQDLIKIIENVWREYGGNWREVLAQWRNKFMHGAKTWAPRAFGVYTNFVCLILWHTIKEEEYESRRMELLKRVKLWTEVGIRDFWSFYPP